MRLPVMLIKEQSFASAAVRACKSIVDGFDVTKWPDLIDDSKLHNY